MASLGKAFGVPIAALSGDRTLIDEYRAGSKVRQHCSPPSAAAVAGGLNALSLNRRRGEALRRKLLKNVRLFRAVLGQSDIRPAGALLPVQSIDLKDSRSAERLHARLHRNGVECVLHRPSGSSAALISFLITASHRPAEIARGAAHLCRALKLSGSAPDSRIQRQVSTLGSCCANFHAQGTT